MKTKNIFQLIFLLVFSLTTVSCDEGGDPAPGATKVVNMAGDWYVQTYVGESLVLDYSLISTYNTADDNGQEMWVDDHQNIWWFKATVPVDVKAQTFSGSDLPSSVDDYDITVNISNGKIIDDIATSTGGNKTDSIYMDIEFSDDPGTIYTLKGYRRTGFLEDEH